MRKLIGQQIGEAMTLTLTEGHSGNCLAESHPDVNHNMHPMHKKGLPFVPNQVYGYSAPAKSGARIGVLVKYKATHDAPSVFFCVLASSHPFFSGMAILHVARSNGGLDGGGAIRAGYLVRRLRQPCSAHHQ
ncbi:ash family protein [Leclercia adecarboxylata]|uniref:ash family protein n=1 Tax=Leclercia adecarboxylata TaxID=83655 RepID=UPI0015F0265B